MRCPKCNGEVVPHVVHLPLGQAMMTLHGYRCSEGHSFHTAQQLANAREHKLPAMKLRRKVSVSGNALVVRIPKDLADALKMTEGDEVSISLNGEKSFLVEV